MVSGGDVEHQSQSPRTVWDPQHVPRSPAPGRSWALSTAWVALYPGRFSEKTSRSSSFPLRGDFLESLSLLVRTTSYAVKMFSILAKSLEKEAVPVMNIFM